MRSVTVLWTWCSRDLNSLEGRGGCTGVFIPGKESWAAVGYITCVIALMNYLEQVEGYSSRFMEGIALWVNKFLCVTAQFLLFARAAYSILKIRMVFFSSRGWHFLAELVFHAILFNINWRGKKIFEGCSEKVEERKLCFLISIEKSNSLIKIGRRRQGIQWTWVRQ